MAQPQVHQNALVPSYTSSARCMSACVLHLEAAVQASVWTIDHFMESADCRVRESQYGLTLKYALLLYTAM